MPNEPNSLYLYGTDRLAAHHIWQTIYDGPLDSRSYGYQPVILNALPHLSDGSAVTQAVTVQAGERVLAITGEITTLAPGVTVRNSHGQRVTFDGTPLQMSHMVVTFTLRPDVYWSDGALLTAADSVFSFELAAAPSTPSDKYIIEHTASYTAPDVRTVVWRGIPGFVDHAYQLNFWHPLPRHAWGHLSPTDLLSADISTRQPIGWGPFIITAWIAGDQLTAVRNPIYFRAPEGLPRVDEIRFRFIPDPITLAEELVNGGCDVLTHDAAEAARTALPDQPAVPIQSPSTYDARWELLTFGISPHQTYDRPDFFEDVRVRQAIALCIDRQTVVNQLLGPAGRVLHSYLPPEHPLYAGDGLTTWGYASTAGQTLLATVGWYDEDGDGVREAHAIPGIADGTPFQITYHTTDEPLRQQTAQLLQTYLAGCGIQVRVETVSPQTLFAPGPDGVLFGRRFDLAQFSWRATTVPLCDTFLSAQLPDEGHWYRPNVAGLFDDEYDTACLAALNAPPGSQAYQAQHVEAQRIFSERLPALPLFQRLKTTLARAAVVGLSPDPTQRSELWNIEQLSVQP